ncbi:MAG: S6e family ribosomal protein [Candidatus Aenigmatarchaeota archaeon]
MAVFKFVVGAKDGRAVQIEKDQNTCASLLSKAISEDFSGDIIGLNGYILEITGGSDKDGFPMRKDIEGVMRKKFVLVKGVGFSGRKRRGKKQVVKIQGLRKKRTLRGNVINQEIVQINCKVKKQGEKSLNELFPPKQKEPSADSSAEKPLESKEKVEEKK